MCHCVSVAAFSFVKQLHCTHLDSRTGQCLRFYFLVQFSTLVSVFPERLADQVRHFDEICLYMQKILNIAEIIFSQCTNIMFLIRKFCLKPQKYPPLPLDLNRLFGCAKENSTYNNNNNNNNNNYYYYYYYYYLLQLGCHPVAVVSPGGNILLGFVLLLQRTINTPTFCWALCFR